MQMAGTSGSEKAVECGISAGPVMSATLPTCLKRDVEITKGKIV